jgi:LmbE family N-acetylglucosaminyl deacetylase
MCAVYPDARNPFAFEGTECAELEDWAVDEVWVMLGDEALDFIDITSQLDRKIRALLCHESQHKAPEALAVRMREWWKQIAADRGRPEGTSAEAFRVVDTR